MIPTGFIWDEKYLKHDVGEMKYNFKNSNVIEVGPEFEHPQRAIVIKEILAKTGVLEKMVPFSPYEAKTEDLLRVHSEEHIKWVMEACKKRDTRNWARSLWEFNVRRNRPPFRRWSNESR